MTTGYCSQSLKPVWLSRPEMLKMLADVVTFVLSDSTNKGVNLCSKYITWVQQQKPESSTVTLTWNACKYKVHKLHQRYILFGPDCFCSFAATMMNTKFVTLQNASVFCVECIALQY